MLLVRTEDAMNDKVSCSTIEVNGAALYVEECGQGAPLVLIHGGLVSSVQWQPLLPELIDDFRVITPDSRGHGRSNNPDGRLSYAQIADDACRADQRVGTPDVRWWAAGATGARLPSSSEHAIPVRQGH